MRIARSFLTLTAVLLLTGCRSIGGTVVTAADRIKQAADSLSQGLQGLDPLAIKGLVSENQEIRDDLESIRRTVNSLSLGQGVITLRERRLALRVPHNTGAFTVTAWVDDRTNWAWQDRRFVNRELTLPINDETAFVEYCKANFNPDEGVCWGQFLHLAQNIWGAIRWHNANHINPAFHKFLREAPLTPGPDTSLIEIGEARLTTGDHTISFEVTPVATDSNGRWSFRGQLIVIAANGSESVIKEFDLLDERFPGHALASPLPIVTASIRVAASS